MFSKNVLFRLLINTSIGAIFIYFWLKLVDINSIFSEISKIELISLLPFILFFILSNIFRSLRLKLLLKEFKIPLKNVIFLTYLGQLLSFTIPIRIGEIAKGVYLSTEYNIPASKSVIWIFIDRFLDFWLILVTALILLTFIPTNLPSNLIPTLLLAISLMTLGSTLVIFFPEFTKKIIQFISPIFLHSKLKEVFTKITHFLIDTASYLNKGFITTSLLIFLTLLALISDALGWYFLFRIMIENLSFLKIFLGSLISMLTYLIPAAPGYVGSAEASGLAVFSYGLGLDKLATSVITVINHGLTLVCILVSGIISLYLLKFDLNLVWKKFRKD